MQRVRVFALATALATVASGCASSIYRVDRAELARLAATPPEIRGQSVSVRQEPPWEDAPPAAQPVGADTQIVIVPYVEVHAGGGGYHGGGRPPPTTGGGGGGGAGGGKGLPQPGKAADAKETAIAIVAVAVTAVVIMAIIEGSRFIGRAQLHPMHPVHLSMRDGGYVIVPLAQLDANLAAAADHGIVSEREGPWRTLDRAPLDRRGLTYSVLLGAGSSVSADGRLDTGFTSHIQLGYFPSNQLGVVGDLVFGYRQNRVNATLFDTRGGLELQGWPVVLGPVHGGVFGGIGIAQRIEDGLPDGDDNGLALTGGAQIQLELTALVALTARFGVVRAHDELAKEVLVGLSVY
jgi:hypothetical protein